MKIFVLIVWAIVSYFIAPRMVNINIGKTEKNNKLLKWLVLFFIPVIILIILSFVGVVVVTAVTIAGIILILLPVIVIVRYLTVGIDINGKKYRLKK